MTYNFGIRQKVALARTLTGNWGLRLAFHDKDLLRAYTDGRCLYVSTPNYSWGDREVSVWEYLIHHEIGHNIPPMDDLWGWLKDRPHLSPLLSFTGQAVNCLEDIAQELYSNDLYIGRKKIMTKGCWLFEELSEQSLPKDFDLPTLEKARRAHFVLYAWHLLVRSHWQDGDGYSFLFWYEKKKARFGSEELGWLEKLEAGDYEQCLLDTQSTEERYQLVRRILSEVFEMDVDQMEEEDKETYKKYQEAKAAGEKALGEFRKLIREQLESAEQTLVHVHASDKDKEDLDFTADFVPSASPPPDWQDWDVADKVEVVTIKDNIDPHSRYRAELDAALTGFGLSNRVKRLFQSLAVKRYQYSMPKGRLSPKHLYRTESPDPRTAQKIWRQRKEQLTYDTAVSILIDSSGSMDGTRFLHAAHSAILLNDVFNNIKLPLEILAFTDRHQINHMVVKSFSDARIGEKELADRLATIPSRGMGGNSDAEGVLWAYNRLKARKNKRKVLIVFSDGHPASSFVPGIAKYTKDVIDMITREGIVEIHGIGIESEAVREYYPSYDVIDHPEQLEESLFNTIKSKIVGV